MRNEDGKRVMCNVRNEHEFLKGAKPLTTLVIDDWNNELAGILTSLIGISLFPHSVFVTRSAFLGFYPFFAKSAEKSPTNLSSLQNLKKQKNSIELTLFCIWKKNKLPVKMFQFIILTRRGATWTVAKNYTLALIYLCCFNSWNSDKYRLSLNEFNRAKKLSHRLKKNFENFVLWSNNKSLYTSFELFFR